MTFAEMSPLGAAVIVSLLVVVAVYVLAAAFTDWRRARLRRPGRLETPFRLDAPHYDLDSLRRATPLGRRGRGS